MTLCTILRILCKTIAIRILLQDTFNYILLNAVGPESLSSFGAYIVSVSPIASFEDKGKKFMLEALLKTSSTNYQSKGVESWLYSTVRAILTLFEVL